jgi:hypothetical protein
MNGRKFSLNFVVKSLAKMREFFEKAGGGFFLIAADLQSADIMPVK